MKFKGDIIITDPYYVCKKEKLDNYPLNSDYYSFLEKTEYPDCRKLSYEELEEVITKEGFDKEVFFSLLKQPKFQNKFKKYMYESKQYNEENSKYIQAVQEYERNNINDWERCKQGSNMKILGINNYICSGTFCGSCSYVVLNSNTHEFIGKFCADAGMIGIFNLTEVLKYNPKFDCHIGQKWTTTLIKNFDGDIDFEIEQKDHYKEVNIVGKGNINIISKQISF